MNCIFVNRLLIFLIFFIISYVRSDHIFVADVANAGAGWGNTSSLTRTLKSFQGAVNGNSGEPLLYIIIYEENDIVWLEDTSETYGYSYSVYENPSDAFKDANLTQYCDKFVVYDEDDCNLAINAAVTQAGILGCSIVEKDMVSTMVNDFGFSQHTDTDANLCGKFSTNEACQLWQYNNQLNDCNDRWFCWSEGDFEGRNKNIDFCIANKLFTYCADAAGVHGLTDSQTTQRDILDHFDNNGIATGWWSKENPDVQRASEYGHTVAGGGPNLSVFQLLDCNNIDTQSKTTSLRQYDPSKTYVFFSFTQGGAMHNCLRENYEHLTDISLTDPNYRVSERYSFSLIHTTIQALWQPNVPKKLYKIMDSNHLFFGWPFGYVKPSVLDDNGYLEDHLARGRLLMDLMDINDAIINDNYAEGDNSLIEKIAAILKPRSIIYKHQLNTANDEDDEVVFFSGVPVFSDPVFCRLDANNNVLVQATVDAIEDSAAKRQWFWIFLQHTVDATEIEPVMDAIAENEDIVIMPPDELIKLCIDFQPIELEPIDDAFVTEYAQTTNYGNNTALRVRSADSNMAVESFLKFTVSDTNNIISATLKLRAETKDIENCTVYSVSDTSWAEGTITWNNKPSMSSPLDSVSNISSGNWAEFDVIDHIDDNGTFSLGLKTTTDGAGRDWYSKESAYKPILQIEKENNETLPGDFDLDNDIDMSDLSFFIDQWLKIPGVPSADIAPAGGDGFVNFKDYSVLTENWAFE